MGRPPFPSKLPDTIEFGTSDPETIRYYRGLFDLRADDGEWGPVRITTEMDMGKFMVKILLVRRTQPEAKETKG